MITVAVASAAAVVVAAVVAVVVVIVVVVAVVVAVAVAVTVVMWYALLLFELYQVVAAEKPVSKDIRNAILKASTGK